MNRVNNKCCLRCNNSGEYSDPQWFDKYLFDIKECRVYGQTLPLE